MPPVEVALVTAGPAFQDTWVTGWPVPLHPMVMMLFLVVTLVVAARPFR